MFDEPDEENRQMVKNHWYPGQEVALNHVDFGYDSDLRLILKDVTIHGQKGWNGGIGRTTGSGKDQPS